MYFLNGKNTNSFKLVNGDLADDYLQYSIEAMISNSFDILKLILQLGWVK